MDWDSEALKAWDEALKKRDEDIELLRKFFKDDDRKFNQLEARRQHLKAELVSVQEKIEKIASNYHNAEQMVERSGKMKFLNFTFLHYGYFIAFSINFF